MEKGDISNEIVPRLALVFEGLIGVLPKRDVRKHTVARKFGQWKRAVNYYVPNEPIAIRIWDLATRYNFRLSAITWMPHEAVEHIQNWIDDQDLPIGRIMATTPTLLSRAIAHMPDLAAIYDPDPSHRFTFGSKGRIVLDPANTDMLGSF